MHGALERQLSELEHILVHAPDHDGVDLDRLEAVFEGGIDAGERLLDAAQARDLGEAVSVQGVERDVHAVEPGFAKCRRKTREQGAVGGEGDVLDTIDGANFLDEGNDAVRDERFAPGEPHARDALGSDEPHEMSDLLGGEQLVVRAHRDALLGHAVHAAEVALVRDGDAQVVDASAEAVVKFAGHAGAFRDGPAACR